MECMAGNASPGHVARSLSRRIVARDALRGVASVAPRREIVKLKLK
jgi:hypothetical protein